MIFWHSKNYLDPPLCDFESHYSLALMMTAPETAVLADTNETVAVEKVLIGTNIIITAG